MADITFNTASGQTIARELLVAYLNTGTSSSPTWTPLGKRVEDSSMEYDWQDETKKDVRGNTFVTAKKPIITQTFEGPLEGGEAASEKIWNLAVREQNAQALVAQDMLVVHLYAGTANTAAFAERYDACKVLVSTLGGEGGGNIAMNYDVTYGGNRTTGTAAVSDGTVTFTADTI